MLDSVSQEVATNGTVGQSPRLNGRDALQRMVNAQRKLREVEAWIGRLDALHVRLEVARADLQWKYDRARDALEKAVLDAPEELGLSVSERTHQQIAGLGAEISRVERTAAGVVHSIDSEALA